MKFTAAALAFAVLADVGSAVKPARRLAKEPEQLTLADIRSTVKIPKEATRHLSKELGMCGFS